MKWFDNLINCLIKKEKVKTSETGLTPPSGLEQQHIHLQEPVEKIFDKFIQMSKNYSGCLFFDPEENRCYIYKLSDEGVLDLMDISLVDWQEILPFLKSINGKIIVINNKNYSCSSSIFLTNLGERVVVLLFEGEFPQNELLKERKRQSTRWIRELKPPTALTRNNIQHLMEILEKRKDKTHGDIFQMLAKEGIIKLEEIEEIKNTCNILSILSRPVSRKQLVKIIARWLGIDYVDVELSDFDKDLAKQLPEKDAKALNILPFEIEGENIKVAFGNPFDEEAVKIVSELLGKKVIPFMSCEEDIRNELEKLYAVKV